MEYNTTRGKLIIPEYGRNVQKMVQHCLSLADREERNTCARAIIELMGQLNSKYKDSDDFEATLWSHLYIISDFQLDIDSPFELKNEEELNTKPNNIPYPKSRVKYRHYGKSMEAMIKIIAEYEEGEKKDHFVKHLAELMKRSYMTWNRDNVKDEIIFQHLKELSNNKIIVADDLRLHVKLESQPDNYKKKPSHNNNNNNHKRRKRK